MNDRPLIRGKVTLDEVAQAAGVSKASASKALNGRPDVSERTRRRVLEACESLGYAHTPSCAPLKARTIALVADNLETTYTLEVLKGATTAAMRLEADLILFHTSYTDEERPSPEPLTREWADKARAKGMIGVITVTSPTNAALVERLRAVGLAHVAIDPASPLPPGAASISATNWNGGVEATQHLISLGHRRIAFVMGPADSVPCRERFEGYRSALRMNSIPFDPDLVAGRGFSYENGRDVARTLLSFTPDRRPTAIFASNDATALGVYEAARELGIRIPQELSVVGFDDTDMARWAAPALTTVHQPLLEMGAQAVRTTISTKEAGRSSTGPIQLRTRLVERKSTAPAPGPRTPVSR